MTEESASGRHTAFYERALELLTESGTGFLIGGAFAVFHYTGIRRDTKDLDVFCRPEDCPAILKFFAARGYRVEQTDIRWLAKVYEDDLFIDLIFDTPSNIGRVDGSWFDHCVRGTLMGLPVKFVGAEEMIWLKSYVQNRLRYDGADIQHIFLRYGRRLDWRRLLERLNPHWQLLFSNLILFEFIYPADYRGIVPRWLISELMNRVWSQYELPEGVRPVCRGPLIDQHQYRIDLDEWHYKVLQI